MKNKLFIKKNNLKIKKQNNWEKLHKPMILHYFHKIIFVVELK